MFLINVARVVLLTTTVSAVAACANHGGANDPPNDPPKEATRASSDCFSSPSQTSNLFDRQLCEMLRYGDNGP